VANPTEIVPPAVPAAARGNLREVGLLAYPVILTQLSATVMGIVDSAMVGRLGATELAAVGFAGVWSWTVFCLFFGTASGIQTFVAQADGAGRRRECGGWAWQGLYVIVPTTLLCAAAVWVAAPVLLGWLGPSEELQQEALAYLRPRLLGIPGIAIAFVWISFFRGVGNTRTPLYAALTANVVNAVLDYGLIFGKLGLPAWEVAGAGAATAIGEWIYGAFLAAAFSRRALAERFATRFVGPHPADIRRFVRMGVPIGGQWMIDMASFAVFTTLVARMGDVQMAASQAFVMLLSMSFMQAIGISVAASTLVGRYIGAEDHPAAIQSFRSAQKFAGILGGAVALLFLSVPELLMRVFTDDPEVISLGVPLVRLGAVFQLVDAFGIVASGSLRGAGDTRWPFLAQSVLAWGLFVPLAYLLGVRLEGGLISAWIGGTIYVLVLSATLVWRFRSGAWQRIRI
jgi:MATE family multidrug resistance protein